MLQHFLPSVTLASTPLDYPSPPPPDSKEKYGNLEGIYSFPFYLENYNSVFHQLVSSALNGLARLVTNTFNNTKIQNEHIFKKIIHNRAEGQGLITISNHVTAIDDPGIFAPLMTAKEVFESIEDIRWTFCAHDRCFKNPVFATILGFGKCLPVVRGRGIDQPELYRGIERLNHGEWIHMFPEGSRSVIPYEEVRPFKLGICRLIYDSKITPLVLPLYHSGFENILPIGDKIPFSYGHTLAITIGDPIDLSELIKKHKKLGTPIRKVYSLISEQLEQGLGETRHQHFVKFSPKT